MKLITPSLTIEEESGFSNDVLDRENFGKELMNLLITSEDALVVSLDAPWGEGKTTFVKMWQSLLNQNGVKSIYFDAFKHDYVDDAFITIASQILDFLESDKATKSLLKGKLTSLKKKASKVGAELVVWSTKVAIKAATLGAINASDIDELADIKADLAKGTSETISKFVEDRIESHKETVKSIESFRDSLESIAETIKEETGKPLIIIIDELDRCKPTYAVEVIEKIKHFFSVENVIFVLSMNKNQLQEGIKSVYGQGIDANTYLQKFINVECSLPKNVGQIQGSDYSSYCEHLFNIHKLKWSKQSHLLIESVADLSKHLNLSLRDLEKSFTYICIYLGSLGSSRNMIPQLVAFVAVIKVKMPQLYIRLSRKEISLEELLNKTQLSELKFDPNTYEVMQEVVKLLQVCLLTKEEIDSLDYDSINQLTKYHNLRNSENIIPFICKRIDLVSLR